MRKIEVKGKLADTVHPLRRIQVWKPAPESIMVVQKAPVRRPPKWKNALLVCAMSAFVVAEGYFVFSDLKRRVDEIRAEIGCEGDGLKRDSKSLRAQVERLMENSNRIALEQEAIWRELERRYGGDAGLVRCPEGEECR
ncbi:hypothetical protein JW721_00265 [Candidatus Micrarchaeota archaeon]|nr:hypothetical protein [Candidatus Micrarchaeota archaeon]